MIHQMFSIQDTKAQTFNPPFFQKNHQEAIRTFSKICNDSTSMLNQYPEDFILLHVGAFCDETGEIIPSTLSNIGTASQYIKNS